MAHLILQIMCFTCFIQHINSGEVYRRSIIPTRYVKHTIEQQNFKYKYTIKETYRFTFFVYIYINRYNYKAANINLHLVMLIISLNIHRRFQYLTGKLTKKCLINIFFLQIERNVKWKLSIKCILQYSCCFKHSKF